MPRPDFAGTGIGLATVPTHRPPHGDASGGKARLAGRDFLFHDGEMAA